MTTTLTSTGWTSDTNGLWTASSDTLIENSGGVVNLGITANTLAGNDSIIGAEGIDFSNAKLTGFAPIYFGIENLGQIIMGNGQNLIAGIATGIIEEYSVLGIFNEQGKTMTMGNGNNNSITGQATGDGGEEFLISGIYNRSGSITMGNGNNNSVTGIGIGTGEGSYSSGIYNKQGGTITIGNGNNSSITGIGGFYNGIFNRGNITVGNGNDVSITGTAEADRGFGILNDNFNGSNPMIEIGNGDNVLIVGTAIGNESVGIYNVSGSTIRMGDGSGTIRGEAIGEDSLGIFNEGIIDAGGGNDTLFSAVDDNCVSQKVTIDGGGNIYMGAGDDYFQGFGNMNVYGDTGSGNTGEDTLDLSAFNFSDLVINTIGSRDNYAQFTYEDPFLGSTTMTTFEFDNFIFANKTVNYLCLT